jgi:hypothetical protein
LHETTLVARPRLFAQRAVFGDNFTGEARGREGEDTREPQEPSSVG